MKKKSYAEGIVFDQSHVPPEYMPLGDVLSVNKRHHNAILKACMANQARRIRFKRSATDSMGLLFVHRDDAAEITAASDFRHSEKIAKESGVSRLHSAIVASDLSDALAVLCEISKGISLVCSTLERLATAAESMATQPKAEPVGTWRDMNGESL